MFNNLGVLMKKNFIVAALAVLSLSAYADTSFTVADSLQKDSATKSESHVNFYDLKTDLTKNLAGDLMIINKSYANSSIQNRTEVGLNVKQEVFNSVSAIGRASVGLKQTSGSESFKYYTFEPGVQVKLPANLDVKATYYYRDAMDAGKVDNLHELRYQVGYNVTNKDKVSVLYFHSLKGNVPLTNTVGLAYTRNF